MNSAVNRQPSDIVRLTMTAIEAAERGQWDTVMQCYTERGVLLRTTQTSARETEELLRLDKQIHARVHTAQVVLASLLSEATATRQRLQGLHQRLGGQPSAPVTVSMKA